MHCPAAGQKITTVIPDTRFLEYKLDPEFSLWVDSRFRENDACNGLREIDPIGMEMVPISFFQGRACSSTKSRKGRRMVQPR
jgi:hypothetical protein